MRPPTIITTSKKCANDAHDWFMEAHGPGWNRPWYCRRCGFTIGSDDMWLYRSVIALERKLDRLMLALNVSKGGLEDEEIKAGGQES